MVVSRAAPALGGIPAFAQTITADCGLRSAFDISLLNTTRTAERRGGRLTAATLREALVDTVRVFRSARTADVVHIQTALVPATVALRTLFLCGAAKLAGAAVLCHVHSAETSSGRAEAFSPSRLLTFLLRRLRFVDTVLTVSRPGADALRSVLSGRSVEVVDNAVDVEAMPKSSHSAAIPIVLFVGTLTKRKGVDDLRAALRILRERGLVFGMEIVGGPGEVGGAEASSLSVALGEEGWGSSLLGPLSPEAVRERMASADVFVLPSHVEGQPIAILEAMAAGLPIVSTRTGAIPDVVRDGIDGFVVDVGDVTGVADALERLIVSPELRRGMGAAASVRARERFDVSRLRCRLAELYLRAANGTTR